MNVKRLTFVEQPYTANRSLNCARCPMLTKCNCASDCVDSAVNRLAHIEDILGDDYDLARLRELVQADREGRCVVLPFKVGDTAWFTVYGGRPVSSEVSSVAITFRVDGAHYYFETENEDGATDYFHGEAIGKTVFLTREDAEEALEGKKIK